MSLDKSQFENWCQKIYEARHEYMVTTGGTYPKFLHVGFWDKCRIRVEHDPSSYISYVDSDGKIYLFGMKVIESGGDMPNMDHPFIVSELETMNWS